jgi:hypothetical protein
MATASWALISALRTTAERLDTGARFRWTHMGACICGNLAQTVTKLSAEDLHRAALQKAGDWGQQAYDYCPTSGFPIDHVMGAMMDLGLTSDDIHHLERLSGPEVLRQLPLQQQLLNRNDRADVVLYLRTWASLLERRLEPSDCRAVA